MRQWGIKNRKSPSTSCQSCPHLQRRGTCWGCRVQSTPRDYVFSVQEICEDMSIETLLLVEIASIFLSSRNSGVSSRRFASACF